MKRLAMGHRTTTWARIFVLAILVAGCRSDALTRDEANEVLDESKIASQAEALTSVTIELQTDFTIGEAVETAAAELKEAVASQLPCADIVLTDNMLTIDYGAKDGNCTYRGHTLSGVHSVELVENSDSQIVIEHHWEAVSNGVIAVTGDATVTWDPNQVSRTVEHSLNFMRLSDGATGMGSGQRTQKPLPGGLDEGIIIDGERNWHGPRGDWSLDIQKVEMRWTDPVPQAGSYELSTPFNKAVTLSFSRVDDTRIEVTVEGPRREFSFTVKSLGTPNG